MKQLALLLVTTSLGIGGSVVAGPFVGVLIYYLYAVLRPQFLWEWSLQPYGAHDFPWSFYLAVVAMVSTLLTAVGLFRFPSSGPSEGKPTPKLGPTHFLLWAFAIHITLSFLLARNQAHALPYYTECAKLFVMFTVATFAVQRVSQVWILLVTVALADVFVAYEMNFHYFSTGYLFLSQQGFGGLDNNGAALMFAMGIPVCYFLWEVTRSPVRWVYLIGIAFLGHAVMLSFSRGAMLSLLLTAPLLLLLSQRKKQVAGFLCVAAAGVLATAGPQVQERFLSISQHDMDESANSRKTTWVIAIKMATESPIFGFGVRNSNLFTKSYGADMEGRSIHSMYLQLAADSGWVGSGLFVALLGSGWVSTYRTRRKLRGRTDDEAVRIRAMCAAADCSLAIYAIGAAFLSLDTFEFPYIMLLVSAQIWGISRVEPSPTTVVTGRVTTPRHLRWGPLATVVR